MSKRKKKVRAYPNGGDGMFFFHKKTGHPAKQLAHTNKTWTNKRYTHSPNNFKNYKIDEELSTDDEPIYFHKSTFIDKIYTRGFPFYIKKRKKR